MVVVENRMLDIVNVSGYKKLQDPAEITDDFAKQLLVEPLAWGICP